MLLHSFYTSKTIDVYPMVCVPYPKKQNLRNTLWQLGCNAVMVKLYTCRIGKVDLMNVILIAWFSRSWKDPLFFLVFTCIQIIHTKTKKQKENKHTYTNRTVTTKLSNVYSNLEIVVSVVRFDSNIELTFQMVDSLFSQKWRKYVAGAAAGVHVDK